MRIDSFYLVEIVTGFLVNDGTSPTKFQGQRSQTLSTPLYMTDTAQLTALASSFLQDSVNLAAKISALRNQAVLLGAKARAIQHVRDSVVYGAWLWMPESIYKFPFKTDGIGFAGKKSQSAAGVITRRNFAGILKE